MILFATGLLAQGFGNGFMTSRQFSHIWSLGFGKVSAESLLKWGQSGTIANVFLANTPQALLSFAYLTYHGLFTCMLMGKEWSEYAHERKALRVTLPRGLQRSTYDYSYLTSMGYPCFYYRHFCTGLFLRAFF